jgi:hypothetical protein
MLRRHINDKIVQYWFTTLLTSIFCTILSFCLQIITIIMVNNYKFCYVYFHFFCISFEVHFIGIYMYIKIIQRKSFWWNDLDMISDSSSFFFLSENSSCNSWRFKEFKRTSSESSWPVSFWRVPARNCRNRERKGR